jgi:acyl carrier protein
MTATSENRSPHGEPDRVCLTLGAVLGVDPDLLSDDASPSEIPNWDSLNHLSVVMAMESEFEVKLSIEDALEMRTVAAIRRILRARGASV